MQISRDIYSIPKELRNIIYKDMEQQAHHIQILLANELDQYKEKGEVIVDEYIKTLQDSY